VIRPRSTTPDPGPSAAVLYENDEWLDDFFDALGRRNIPYTPVRMDDAAVLLDDPPAYPLVFNRVSPSSYLRGHGPAIGFARMLLDVLAQNGRHVVNGPRSFALETSKVAQLLLFRRVGVVSPPTILFNNQRAVAEVAREFAFPAILKPDCGGSGAYIRRVESYEHLRALLADEPDLFAPDHVLLLQHEFVSGDGAVVRTEFVDGELIYAMRVRAFNTYNLCPAAACERYPADPADNEEPRVEFEPYPDIAPDAVAQAREIVREAGLDVGGVEFVQSLDGTRWFFDINATSVYRSDVCEALGVDAEGKLIDFLDREFHKEVAKAANGRGGAGFMAGAARSWRRPDPTVPQ
jgi:hypothetical protein